MFICSMCCTLIILCLSVQCAVHSSFYVYLFNVLFVYCTFYHSMFICSYPVHSLFYVYLFNVLYTHHSMSICLMSCTLIILCLSVQCAVHVHHSMFICSMSCGSSFYVYLFNVLYTHHSMFICSMSCTLIILCLSVQCPLLPPPPPPRSVRSGLYELCINIRCGSVIDCVCVCFVGQLLIVYVFVLWVSY